jgi:hypothetical protein
MARRASVRGAGEGAVGVGAMGELILFRSAAGPRKESAERGDAAQILFFTGVRYQRAPEPTLGADGGDSDAPRSGGVGGPGGGRRKRRG